MRRALLELKTKATATTVTKEKELLASNNLLPWVHVVDADGLKQSVRDPGHRVQCMHHMSTYNSRFCLYVVAEAGRVLRCVLIESTAVKRQLYRDALAALWNEYMSPFDSVKTIPAGINESNLGFVETVYNMQFHIAYRKGLRELVRKEGCLPPARHILTFFQALWNPLKGGTDQYSRAMEETHGRWENYLQPTQRLTVRTLKAPLVNAFHAYRLCRSVTALITGQTKSYKQHLRRLNKVISLPEYIAHCTEEIGGFMMPIEIPEPELPPSYTATPTPTPSEYVKVIRKFHKRAFNEDKDLIRRRLTKPKEHVLRHRSHENVNQEFKKAPTRCVLCCEKCNHKDGVVIERLYYHRPFGQLTHCPPA